MWLLRNQWLFLFFQPSDIALLDKNACPHPPHPSTPHPLPPARLVLSSPFQHLNFLKVKGGLIISESGERLYNNKMITEKYGVSRSSVVEALKEMQDVAIT